MTEADVATFYIQQSDPIAVSMAVFGPRDADEHAAYWQRIMADPELVARTIEVDGVVVGNVVAWSRDGMRYVGYWLGREFWGRGFATAALRALVGEIEERPLWALVVTSNIGSRRVLEKSGFAKVEQRASPADGVEEFVYRLD